MTLRNLFAQLQSRDVAVRDAARRLLLAAVERHQGDLREAAAELHVSVRTVRKHLVEIAAVQRRGAAHAAEASPAVEETPPSAPVAVAAAPASETDESLPVTAETPARERVVPAVTTSAAAPPAATVETPPPAPTWREAAARTPRRPSAPTAQFAAHRGRSPFEDFLPAHHLPLGRQPVPPPPPTAPKRAAEVPAAPASADREGRIAAAAGAPPSATTTISAPPGAAGEPTAAQVAPTAAAGAAAEALALRGLRAGEWPHHQPAVSVDAPGRAPAPRPRRLAFVLHAHLPWVLGHGTWPHGEDWLAEAVAHCYLPLLGALRRLAEDGRRDLLTLSISPVLAAQLADARTVPLVRGYLAHRREAARGLAADHPLGRWWEERYVALEAAWEEIGGALLPAFAALAARGAIELSTCAVTHGYLPLLHRREHVALQVRAAAHNHARWFGAAPAGMWMPECAYRPSGAWAHPVTGATEEYRPGNERFLAAADLRWTVVDAHAVLGGEPLLPYPGFQLGEPWPASGAAVVTAATLALQPCRVAQSDVAALAREPHTAQQVWSRHGGYPGDARYLDFHKRQAESGLRLWRVTDPAGDLGDKLPYHPDEARAATREHAEHFVALVGALPGADDGAVACPYDAELFGHWWLEGVDWLEEVLRRSATGVVTTTTPSRELVRHPPVERARLQEGSWGEAGDHRMWVNDATSWMWHDLREAEEATAAALPSLAPARARAALAQLLLMAASDWPFLVTSGTATDYASERFALHRDRLRALLAAPHDASLPEWTAQDLAGVELDPRWWEELPA